MLEKQYGAVMSKNDKQEEVKSHNQGQIITQSEQIDRLQN